MDGLSSCSCARECAGHHTVRAILPIAGGSTPATKAWGPVEGSTVDLAKRTVSAPLQHFSAYAVGPKGGKAGW